MFLVGLHGEMIRGISLGLHRGFEVTISSSDFLHLVRMSLKEVFGVRRGKRVKVDRDLIPMFLSLTSAQDVDCMLILYNDSKLEI
jgi:hypothetical protein